MALSGSTQPFTDPGLGLADLGILSEAPRIFSGQSKDPTDSRPHAVLTTK